MPFFQSVAVRFGVKKYLEECGVDAEAAAWIGAGASLATALITADLHGHIAGEAASHAITHTAHHAAGHATDHLAGHATSHASHAFDGSAADHGTHSTSHVYPRSTPDTNDLLNEIQNRDTQFSGYSAKSTSIQSYLTAHNISLNAHDHAQLLEDLKNNDTSDAWKIINNAKPA